MIDVYIWFSIYAGLTAAVHLKSPQYKDQNTGKCERCGENRTSTILGFLQWLRFITAQTNWVSLSFLSCQKVQLSFHFPLKWTTTKRSDVISLS